jgi:hypothetical protein
MVGYRETDAPDTLCMPLYIFCGDFLFCAQLCLSDYRSRRGQARFPRTHPHGMKALILTQEIVDSEPAFSDFVQEHCATIYQRQWYGGNGNLPANRMVM